MTQGVTKEAFDKIAEGLREAIEKFSVMRCAVVSSDVEEAEVMEAAEAQGMKLACASNAGLPSGQVRLTFLPADCFAKKE